MTEPLPIREMNFEQLSAERQTIIEAARGALDALPNETVRRLSEITSRLRSESSTSRAPKRKRRAVALEDIA